MKKHFLLIMLLTVVFLGLGNYSMGQSTNIDQATLDAANAAAGGTDASSAIASTNIDQATLDAATAAAGGIDISSSSNSAPTIDTCKKQCKDTADKSYLSCNALSNALNDAQDPLSSPKEICIVGVQKDQSTCENQCSITQNNGTNLTPCTPNKANAHVNMLTQCVCNDGYKDVDNICKKCSEKGVCCGISLNTSVPFIGNCIENDKANVGAGEETSVTGATAFPVLMSSLTQILVTVILILSFVLIIVGGIMIATGNPSGGKGLIIKVVIGIALLGASGVILRLINPNFFG